MVIVCIDFGLEMGQDGVVVWVFVGGKQFGVGREWCWCLYDV